MTILADLRRCDDDTVLGSMSADGRVLHLDYMISDGSVHRQSITYPSVELAQLHAPATLRHANRRYNCFETRPKIGQAADYTMLSTRTAGPLTLNFYVVQGAATNPWPVVFFRSGRLYLSHVRAGRRHLLSIGLALGGVR